jgi:uncharacterized membrane protein YbhN (UPF0104 family)
MLMLFVWGIANSGIERIAARLDERFWLAILAAQPVVLATIVVMGMRLSELLRRPRIRFLVGIKAFALFAGLNLFLPARLAELLKATYARDNAGVALSEGFAGVLLGVLLDLAVFSLIAIFCLTFVVGRAMGEDMKTTFVLIAGVSLALIVAAPLLLRLRLGEGLMRALSRVPVLGGLLGRMTIHAIGQMTPSRLALLMAFSIAGWTCSFGAAFTVLHVLGEATLGPGAALAVLFATIAGAMIPVLPGGLGTSEAGVVLVLMALGQGFDSSLAIAIALRLSFALTPLVLAGLIILRERTGLRQLLGDLYRIAGDLRKRPVA